MNRLDDIRIASPCAANWNDMHGDDRTRWCGACRLHVHDLSAMTRSEAEALLQRAGQGRLCVRFHRRADGRVLTRDCPVGLRQRLRATWARAAALWIALWGCAAACVRGKPEVVDPTATPVRAMGEFVMGDAVAPTPVEPAAPRQR